MASQSNVHLILALLTQLNVRLTLDTNMNLVQHNLSKKQNSNEEHNSNGKHNSNEEHNLNEEQNLNEEYNSN